MFNHAVRLIFSTVITGMTSCSIFEIYYKKPKKKKNHDFIRFKAQAGLEKLANGSQSYQTSQTV